METTEKCENCPMKEKFRSLIYWRSPIWSATVLTILLAAQLSFLYFSAISIVAYVGFFLLISVNAGRLYYHYVAKTKDNFIRDYLERDISIPQDKAADVSRRLTDLINNGIAQTKETLLLTNMGNSIKFGLLLYLMTYVGARFNFLTLLLIATTLVFFVPKFYERYQPEIDRLLKLVKDKANDGIAKVNEKMKGLPIFGSRKPKTQ